MANQHEDQQVPKPIALKRIGWIGAKKGLLCHLGFILALMVLWFILVTPTESNDILHAGEYRTGLLFSLALLISGLLPSLGGGVLNAAILFSQYRRGRVSLLRGVVSGLLVGALAGGVALIIGAVILVVLEASPPGPLLSAPTWTAHDLLYLIELLPIGMGFGLVPGAAHGLLMVRWLRRWSAPA